MTMLDSCMSRLSNLIQVRASSDFDEQITSEAKPREHGIRARKGPVQPSVTTRRKFSGDDVTHSKWVVPAGLVLGLRQVEHEPRP